MIGARRAAALDLRLAGVDRRTIGRKLAADPMVNSDGVSFTFGYGLDRYRAGKPPPTEDALARLVDEDIARTIRARTAHVTEGLDELRAIQDSRIERLIASLWGQALKGTANGQVNTDAHAALARLLDRQAKLHGLDAPARTELSGARGGPVQLMAVEDARREALAYLDTLTAARSSAGTEPDEDAGARAAAEALPAAPGDAGEGDVMAADLGNGE